jgi:hypothetical protein
MAPTETKSTFVLAIAAMVRSVTLPEASVATQPDQSSKHENTNTHTHTYIYIGDETPRTIDDFESGGEHACVDTTRFGVDFDHVVQHHAMQVLVQLDCSTHFVKRSNFQLQCGFTHIQASYFT